MRCLPYQAAAVCVLLVCTLLLVYVNKTAWSATHRAPAAPLQQRPQSAFERVCDAEPPYERHPSLCYADERPTTNDPLTCLPRPARLRVALSIVLGDDARSVGRLCETLRTLQASDIMEHAVTAFAWVTGAQNGSAARAFAAWPAPVPRRVLGVGHEVVPSRVRMHDAVITTNFDVLVEIDDTLVFPELWFDELVSHRATHDDDDDDDEPVAMLYPVVVPGVTRADMSAWISGVKAATRVPSSVGGLPWVLDLPILQACAGGYYDLRYSHAEDNITTHVERGGCKHVAVATSWVGRQPP
eukprot:TRINITY_DN1067_c0_g1_i1.p2 TRINITY_DN1067_c0_g1~~TRINITY_DN1067_c0_g1_i1.p2  ORF type:complete len:299 (-),score=82.02 TRINITY_DN1067_c0_g1_i1:74-970(-)